MQEELNRRIRQGDAQRIKPRDPKEMAAEGQREMRAQMTRLKTSVANAVSKRRFLFDQYKVDARKRDARKNVCECLQFFFFDCSSCFSFIHSTSTTSSMSCLFF